jgi:hypothetical protein
MLSYTIRRVLGDCRKGDRNLFIVGVLAGRAEIGPASGICNRGLY